MKLIGSSCLPHPWCLCFVQGWRIVTSIRRASSQGLHSDDVGWLWLLCLTCPHDSCENIQFALEELNQLLLHLVLVPVFMVFAGSPSTSSTIFKASTFFSSFSSIIHLWFSFTASTVWQHSLASTWSHYTSPTPCSIGNFTFRQYVDVATGLHCMRMGSLPPGSQATGLIVGVKILPWSSVPLYLRGILGLH